ncbi:ribokinase [Thermoanaerobacterium sp. PSU-2]|uniref:ribokinase n=1 Tax=Thermoanaerobacterium sp. PSU-2 TaxID=1930849 RepID=UPI000A155A91|nr:ribokinase [Thermoanaerobacterium sp. PSU-2]ORX22677.1 ribokinase [Thermoanaerobacterium sp. PSU-2]
MSKVIVVGSINMDIILRVDHIPSIGETIIAKAYKKSGGGKGANQAVASAKLGGNVCMIGRAGNDENGKILYNDLKKYGVNVEGIVLDDCAQTGSAYINVSDKGENNIIILQGANNRLSISQIKKYEYLFDDANYCILQLEIPIATVEYVAKYCYKRGIKVILNPAPAITLSENIYHYIYLIVPNETELSLLTRKTITDKESLIEASRFLLNKGVKNVITTLGEKGSFLMNNEITKYYPSVKVHAVDTTAAGDTFIGALATLLSENKSIDESIIYATYASAITVTREGAQVSIPDRDEVNKFIKEYRGV